MYDYTVQDDIYLSTPDTAYVDFENIDFMHIMENPDGEDFSDETGYGYFEREEDRSSQLFPGDYDWNDGNDPSHKKGVSHVDNREARFQGKTTAEINKMLEEDDTFTSEWEDEISDLNYKEGDEAIDAKAAFEYFDHLAEDLPITIAGQDVTRGYVSESVAMRKETEEFQEASQKNMAFIEEKFESIIKSALRGQAETDLRYRDTMTKKMNEVNPQLRGMYDIQLDKLASRRKVLNDVVEDLYSTRSQLEGTMETQVIADTEFSLRKEYRDYTARKERMKASLEPIGIDVNTLLLNKELFKLVQDGLNSREQKASNKRALKRVNKPSPFGAPLKGQRPSTMPRGGNTGQRGKKYHYAQNMGNLTDREMNLAFDHLED